MTRTADARLLADVLASAIPFRLALTGTFRGLQHREGVLFEGPSGWGEFAPFDDYSDERAARWLASALEASYGTWPAALRDELLQSPYQVTSYPYSGKSGGPRGFFMCCSVSHRQKFLLHPDWRRDGRRRRVRTSQQSCFVRAARAELRSRLRPYESNLR